MGHHSKIFVPVAIGVVAVVVGGAVIYLLLNNKKKPLTTLNPNVKIPLRLVDKEIITHNTRRFKFALPTVNHILGLPIGQHVYLSANVNGALVTRPYTPITDNDQKGYVDLVVKIYKKGLNENHPEGGKMSQYLDSLSIGDTMDFRGPGGSINYKGSGEFVIKVKGQDQPVRRKVKRIGLIAGGTGITPVYQLIQSILKDAKDDTELFLLFSNSTEDDIILRDLLDSQHDKYPDQFHVWYTVSRAKPGWNFSIGHVTADMIRNRLPAPSEDTLILMCGPPAMVNNTLLPALEQVGHSKEMCFSY